MLEEKTIMKASNFCKKNILSFILKYTKGNLISFQVKVIQLAVIIKKQCPKLELNKILFIILIKKPVQF